MESEESAKVSRTKHLISTQLKQLLLHKSFKQISVDEICKQALISRSTFYLHFQDKYDLLKFCIGEKLKDWAAALKGKSIEFFIDFTLSSVLEDKTLYHNAFLSEPSYELMNIMRDELYKLFYDYMEEKQAQCEVPKPLTIVTAFYLGAIINVITQWIYTDFAESKEEVAQCLSRLMPEWLR